MNIPEKNTSLSPRSRMIQNLQFYGEFLALISFDDGWKETVYPLFQQYIEEISQTLQNSGIDIQQQETQNTVEIILSVSKHSKENIKSVFEITRDIQREYDFSPVAQYVKKSFDCSQNPLPIICKEAEEGSIFEPRLAIQTIIANIKKLRYTLEDTIYRVAWLEKIFSPNADIKNKIQEQKKLIQLLEDSIQKQEESIPNIVGEQYFLISQMERVSPPKLVIENIAPEERKNNSDNVQEQADSNLKISGKDSEIEHLTKLVETVIKKVDILGNVAPNEKQRKEGKSSNEKPQKEKQKPQKLSAKEINDAYLATVELSPGEIEIINTIKSELLDPIEKTYQDNKHQSNEELLKNALKKHSGEEIEINIRGSRCRVEINYLEYEESLSNTIYEISINSNIPYIELREHIGSIQSKGNLSYKIRFDLKEDGLNKAKKLVSNNIRELAVYAEKIGELRSIYHNIWFVDSYLERILNEMTEKTPPIKGEVPLLHNIRIIDQYLDERDQILQEVQVSKEYQDFCSENLFQHEHALYPEGANLFSSKQGIIDFFQTIQRIEANKNWKNALSTEHIKIPHKIDKIHIEISHQDSEKVNKSKTFFQDGEIYIALYSKHGETMRIDTSNLHYTDNIYKDDSIKISFGSPLKESISVSKWNSFRNEDDKKRAYLYSRDIKKYSIIKIGVLQHLSTLYTISDVSGPREDERNTYLFTTVKKGKAPTESFFVVFGGEVQWDEKEKAFYPHCQATVMPASGLGGDPIERIQEVHSDICSAFQTYNQEYLEENPPENG